MVRSFPKAETRNRVKKITLVTLLLLFSAFAWAGTILTPADYTINIHVSASLMVVSGRSIAYTQKLSVVIDGKQYELESSAPPTRC